MTKTQLIVGDLASELQRAIAHAESFYALVAFARTSGVSAMAEDFRRLSAMGGDVKLLTGDYLYLTEPDALLTLYNIGVETRLWRSHGQSFHPKAYLLERQDESEIFVGSSNLSRSGLRSGVEWNLRVVNGAFDGIDPSTAFLELFYSDRTVPVNPVTIDAYRLEREQHAFVLGPLPVDSEDDERDPGRQQPAQDEFGPPPQTGKEVPIPRPAQREALQALVESRSDGFTKGLVVLPTGLGKTYVAAFFAQAFRRVLFVAHRDEILRQAADSFHAIMPERSTAFFTGYDKGTADIVLASVYTLGSKRHRERFPVDAFDLVVVDEFHHAAARSYSDLMAYFRPDYLLGLTATPERTDHKDVYALCDGNLVYQVTLPEAIRQGWLSPFHYYGAYDPIDYSRIRWRENHYDDVELSHAQMRHQYANAVLAAWQTHHQSRTLLFGSSRVQSRYLAEHFQATGIRARHVDGETPIVERREAVSALERGELDVLCSVDLFNEGVDIPLVDTILLARPTDSMVVFVQQIGRGLRVAAGKDDCTIIDMVGNYRNADSRIAALGVGSLASLGRQVAELSVPGLPECHISLDLAVIDVLHKLRRRATPRAELLRLAYLALKSERGRGPTYVEFHLFSGLDSTWIRKEFGSYVGMVSAIGELDDREESVYQKHRGWLEAIEKTRMEKSYKMVLLKTMLDRGERWSTAITAREAARHFYDYLHAEPFRRVDCNAQPKLSRPFDVGDISRLIAQMPMHHLAASLPDYLQLDGERLDVLAKFSSEDDALVREWTTDIVDYRLHYYFFERHAGQGDPRRR